MTALGTVERSCLKAMRLQGTWTAEELARSLHFAAWKVRTHLGVLMDEGLVRCETLRATRRRGRTRCYYLTPEGEREARRAS